MPTKPFDVEVYILTAEAEEWLKLETILSASGEFPDLLRALRYKLWRTGHLPQPE